METATRSRICAFALLLPAAMAGAGPLDGKSYIIDLSSSQSSSGYGDYLLASLASVLAGSGIVAKNGPGPGVDVVVNIVTHSGVGQWLLQGEDRQWICTFDVTVGISPESCMIPFGGTPVFGVRARLLTPNSDREDKLVCRIKLAARTALAAYRPEGIFQTDGSGCLRKQGANGKALVAEEGVEPPTPGL